MCMLLCYFMVFLLSKDTALGKFYYFRAIIVEFN